MTFQSECRRESSHFPEQDEPASHVVFFDGKLAPRAGGPSGYLWNLRRGLADYGKLDRVQFVTRGQALVNEPPAETFSKAMLARPILQHLVEKLPYARSVQRSLLGGNFYREWRRNLYIVENPSSVRLDADIASKINFEAISSIHVHETTEAIVLHNELKARGVRSRVKLILTSHCPELPGFERGAAYRSAGLFKRYADRLQDAHVRADEYAFSIADLIIFPSPESMQPYIAASASISKTLKTKDVRYVLTGTDSKKKDFYPVPEALEALKNKFTVCFVGRHNSVKGYDLLKDAAKILFDKYQDVAVVVAGHLGPIAPPQHPNWVELGWTPNPESVIAACDVFLLPNRSTFFDLVLLEVMSIGKPVIASATGGNVTVANMSSGIFLFDGLEDLVAKLEKMRGLSKSRRNNLAQANQQTYRDNFTLHHFAARYLNIINDLAASKLDSKPRAMECRLV